MWTLLAACVSTTGTSGTAESAAPTAGTGDTAATLAVVRVQVYEADRDCWAFWDVERPAEHWHYWLDYTFCGESDSADRTDWAAGTVDGHCLRFQNARQRAECRPTDPWTVPCEEVAGCCDLVAGGRLTTCYPEFYQP